MDVTVVTGAAGALRPEEGREKNGGSAGQAFDLFLNLPPAVGAATETAAENRERDQSNEERMAEREARSREVIERRARNREEGQDKRIRDENERVAHNTAVREDMRSEIRERREREADEAIRINEELQIQLQASGRRLNDDQALQRAAEEQDARGQESEQSRSDVEAGAKAEERALDGAKSSVEAARDAIAAEKPSTAEPSTDRIESTEIPGETLEQKIAAGQPTVDLEALLADKQKLLELDGLELDETAKKDLSQLLDRSRAEAAKALEIARAARAIEVQSKEGQQLVVDDAAHGVELELQNLDEAAKERFGLEPVAVQAKAAKERFGLEPVAVQAKAVDSAIRETLLDESATKQAFRPSDSRMSGEALAAQNRSDSQSAQGQTPQGEQFLNVPKGSNAETNEWARLLEESSPTAKMGKAGTGKIGDSVQLSSVMKGAGADIGPGRSVVGPGVQDPSSLRVKAASSAAAAQKGQAPQQALPEGVDEMAILRQISDGLRFKPGRSQTAFIRLHPAELGQVQVRIQMDSGNARIVVNTESAAVGELVSSQLDQLRRDILAQGVQVTHLEVRNELGDQRNRDEEQAREGEELEEADRGSEQNPVRVSRGDGRIDIQA
jgi:flagellar hook-length control protein FliK